MLRYGVLKHIRSDNGPEFVARAVRSWLARLGVQTLFIEPGSPWENGYIESFNGKLRDELLNGEVFSSVPEAKVLTDAWRPLQSPPTSQRIGISATRTGGHQTEVNSHILTLDVDTLVGAGQFHPTTIGFAVGGRLEDEWSGRRMATSTHCIVRQYSKPQQTEKYHAKICNRTRHSGNRFSRV
jgi:hypothetical protein